MKKTGKVLLTALALTITMCSTAFAGTWKQDSRGWWYQEKEGKYPASTWQWVDGNGDGLAECYYFDQDGYLLTNTTTPDGFMVNQDGAWTQDGIVKEKAMNPSAQISQMDEGMRLYKEASEKTSALNSVAATAKVDMSMTSEGSTLGMSMNMDIKYKDINTSAMKLITQVDVNLLGQSMTGTMFYTDGYYYMDMSGQKIKMAMNMDQLMAQVKESTQITGMNLDYMKDFQVTADADGNRVISYNIDSQALMDYMQTIYSYMGMNVSDYQMNFRDMSGTIVINPDGYSKSEVIDMTMDMTTAGQTVSTTIHMDMSYVNPGQAVEFTLPSTDGYEEMAQ